VASFVAFVLGRLATYIYAGSFSFHLSKRHFVKRMSKNQFAILGQQFGTIIGLPLCGYLISYESLGGWPSVFYTMGSVGVVWFVFWTFLVYDKPQDHPRIKLNELRYIQNTIGLQVSAVRFISLRIRGKKDVLIVKVIKNFTFSVIAESPDTLEANANVYAGDCNFSGSYWA